MAGNMYINTAATDGGASNLLFCFRLGCTVTDTVRPHSLFQFVSLSLTHRRESTHVLSQTCKCMRMFAHSITHPLTHE